MTTQAMGTRERLPATTLFGTADWLFLAASPTFAVMAALAARGPQHMLCAASPLSGMVWMYVLMSAFHSTPWLRLLAGWRSGASS